MLREARLLNHRLYAALAYCRANQLNRIVIDRPHGVALRYRDNEIQREALRKRFC